MDDSRVVTQVDLGGGARVLVEVVPTTLQTPVGNADGAAISVPANVAETISEIGRVLVGAAKAVSPSKFSCEFGLELSGSAGIPLVTKGSATAHFTVTLEWDDSSA